MKRLNETLRQVSNTEIIRRKVGESIEGEGFDKTTSQIPSMSLKPRRIL